MPEMTLGYGATDLFFDRCQSRTDFPQGRVAIGDRQEGEVDVQREPRHVVVEQVESGTALQSEFPDLGHCGYTANQQVHLGSIAIPNRHDCSLTVACVAHHQVVFLVEASAGMDRAFPRSEIDPREIQSVKPGMLLLFGCMHEQALGLY